MNEFLKANVGQFIVAAFMVVGLVLAMNANHAEVVRKLERDAGAINALEGRIETLENTVALLSVSVSGFHIDTQSKDAEQDVRIGYLEGMVK